MNLKRFFFVSAISIGLLACSNDDDATDGSNPSVEGNNYPLQSDAALEGLTYQRRNIDALSVNSIIRNYYYQINAYLNPTSTGGGIEIKACIQPWKKDIYRYMFYGDKPIVIPPIIPTDSTIIIDTDCGKIEMRYNEEILPMGLQGAYGDEVVWWDPAIQGPRIEKGEPPYYCEQKYGAGWRLINSCELMSFLALFDATFKIWESNTWIGMLHKCKTKRFIFNILQDIFTFMVFFLV